MELLVAVLMVAGPGGASAALPGEGSSIDAPGLTAGPFIVHAGLVWESASGVMLTDAAGRSTVLAPPDAANWEDSVDLAWFGPEWWVLARPTGVFAGRIGGPLHELPMLRRCNPATQARTSDGTLTEYAVGGDHLYVAVHAACLARRPPPLWWVVDVNLRTRRWHILARISGSLESMAASGNDVALAYRHPRRSTGEPPLLVRVLKVTTGAVTSQFTPPPSIQKSGAGGIRSTTAETCSSGSDVVGRLPGSWPMPHSHSVGRPNGGWRKQVHRVLGRLCRVVTLCEGRVAYFSSDGASGAEAIDVDRRTVVVFAGTASGEGLALSGNELASSQQSAVVNVVTATGASYSCTPVPLSPVELASLDVRDIPSTPVLVSGVPVPPQYANEPPCIEI